MVGSVKKITKKAIEKAVFEATGFKTELHKTGGFYYWSGDAAICFRESCLYVTTLNWEGATLDFFVGDFKNHLEESESYRGVSVAEQVKRMNAAERRQAECKSN